MTTTILPIHFLNERTSAFPQRRAIGDRLAMGLTALAFLSSILQYRIERNDLVRLVPVALVIAASLSVLLVSTREKRHALVVAVSRPGTLALIMIVSLPPLISSLYRSSSYPLQYGVAIIAVLFATRILLSAFGLEGLLLCFFWGTTLAMLIVVATTLPELLAAGGSSRYAPLYLDPNRTGLLAVTAIPAQLWFTTRGKLNKLALIAAIVCVWVVVAASSRGSIGALLIGAAFATVLCLARRSWRSGFSISRHKLLIGLASLCVLAGVAAAELSVVERAGDYLRTKLELDTRARGLDSGLTGRTRSWSVVLDVLPKTSWLSGNGYRTTDEDFHFSVDNGYLAGIYELGLWSTMIIVSKYLLVVGFLSVLYLKSRSASAGCLLALAFTLVIFLANAFVHRILFGSGDSASLVALFMFVSNRRDALIAAQTITAPSH